MTTLLDRLTTQERQLVRPRAQPRFIAPMLASLTDVPFSHPDWVFERKLDGVRLLGFRSGEQVRLVTRNDRVVNHSYPEIVEALARQARADFIVDGEVVAFEGRATSFQRLQERIHLSDPDQARATGVAVYYYLFDLLYVEGCDITPLPLRTRKGLLRRALEFAAPLRLTTHRNQRGEQYFREACRNGWEGLIAKRADSRYLGRRSRDWLKFKCVNQQEFVIGGYTDPQRSRIGFGALLVGYYQGDQLRYAGRVGTGFDQDTLRRLKQEMARLETDRRPFAQDDIQRRGVHWVEPRLVCEVGFAEWTDDGRLRHPRFLGLRRDKAPHQVRRETPARP